MSRNSNNQIDYPVLAIDFGEKHIGVAVSDNTGKVAKPIDTINIKSQKKLAPALNKIANLVEKWQAETILLGLPQAFTKSQKKTQSKIISFEEQLKSTIDKPIIKYDESYSTIRAQDMLRLQGKTSRSTRHKIDSVASAVFLQEFLNLQTRKSGESQHDN
ncbi:Holliday junction resolvase RuvX [Candidatus Dojkabacteria bacterium]|nr:Holliday junction resolvase RuvX [Candidatus Dojkabacteria bacterium]